MTPLSPVSKTYDCLANFHFHFPNAVLDNLSRDFVLWGKNVYFIQLVFQLHILSKASNDT